MTSFLIFFLVTSLSMAQDLVLDMYTQQIHMPLPETYSVSPDLHDSICRVQEQRSLPFTLPETVAENLAQSVVLQDVTLHRLFILMDQREQLRLLRERIEKLRRGVFQEKIHQGLRGEERDEWRKRLSDTTHR